MVLRVAKYATTPLRILAPFLHSYIRQTIDFIYVCLYYIDHNKIYKIKYTPLSVQIVGVVYLHSCIR